MDGMEECDVRVEASGVPVGTMELLEGSVVVDSLQI